MGDSRATLGASQIRSIFSLAHILARLYSWLISNQEPFVSISLRLHGYRQDQITPRGNKERDEDGWRGRDGVRVMKGVKQGTRRCKTQSEVVDNARL